jgi:HEAT repeats
MGPQQYLLADVVRDIESSYRVAEPETFWLCEQALLHLLARGLLSRWLNEQLKSLVEDPQHVGDWSAKEAVLHRGKGWTLSVAVFDTQRRFVHALPFSAIYSPLQSALTGDRYRLPDDFKNDVFDPGLRLEPAGTVKVGRHELLRLETDRFAYDFHISQPIPVLRFVSAAQRPLEWLFSKNTLQAWQANDADLSSTQLRVAAYVLGKIAHHSSVAPLRELAAHPNHAVRWAAIQNLGRLSRSEALVKIRQAINDPHPHVRRAAQKTLDQLDKRAPR